MKTLLLMLFPMVLFAQTQNTPIHQLSIVVGTGILDQQNKTERFTQCPHVSLSLNLTIKHKTEVGVQFGKSVAMIDPEYIHTFISGYAIHNSPFPPYRIHYKESVDALHYRIQSIFLHGSRYLVSGKKFKAGIKVLAGLFSGTMPPYSITCVSTPGNGGNPHLSGSALTQTKYAMIHSYMVWG